MENILLKLEDIEDIKNILIGNDTDYENINTSKYSNVRCDDCEKKKRARTLSVHSRNDKTEVYKITICIDCVVDISEEIEKIKNDFDERIKVWDEVGVVIIEHDSNPRRDLIEGMVKNGDLCILILTNELCYEYVKLSNVGELIDLINRRKKDMETYYRNLDCEICGAGIFAEVGENMLICSSCLDDIEQVLRDYIKDNKKQFIANEI